MASAAGSSLTNMSVVVPVFSVAGAASAAWAVRAVLARHDGDVRAWAVRFLTGPGRTSRLLLLLFMALNLKSLPFAWTARIFCALIRHTLWPRKPLPPPALFHYSITRSRTSLLETDYNFHKSNSTYFADLDASRTHLVMYLLGPGFAAVGRNASTKIVPSPADGVTPMAGSLGVGLGAVFCSFRKEIAPYQPYEMWSRVLAWDRKWLYIVTHFVVKGKVRPAGWDGWQGGPTAQKAWTAADEANLQKYVIATAVSKYVFKLGRFTVHPSYLIEASGLLPTRPGDGWRGGGAEAVGTVDDADEAELMSESPTPTTDSESDGETWTWKNVERERRRGMALAGQFAALDDAGALFDGGKNGALGIFGPG
ncbi:hypothetical protein SPBR_01848 [Sporothrix brasiliensis 5110]|uniref:Capsule polysaccharide biosynthesis protein n=1 Tax=Sporothrix brasiliensis 5110 TaxID=1398154 RepID=A0A0C2FJ76_9PEZI|nr:uncharacterized protein SPBR_01848 [Sporothrix brasiliensis 5110]KIH91123.1 hypothetical protein SPBR_01848 [Sporothrix brasiliensis 5110]